MNRGTAAAPRNPRTTITITSSMRVKPDCPPGILSFTAIGQSLHANTLNLFPYLTIWQCHLYDIFRYKAIRNNQSRFGNLLGRQRPDAEKRKELREISGNQKESRGERKGGKGQASNILIKGKF
jgi:hypothetical protein